MRCERTPSTRVVYAATITSGPDRERDFPNDPGDQSCRASPAWRSGLGGRCTPNGELRKPAAAYGDAGFGHWGWDGPMVEEETRSNR